MTAAPFTQVGLQLAGYAFPGVPDEDLFDRVRAIATTAEASGFDSLWTMDHVHQIATVGGPDEPILEAYMTLAALAAVTRTARLGVLVSAGGLRQPALVAKMVTTLDVISRGRAILGLGAGWFEEEYDAYGVPFPPLGERLERLAEAVQICRAMFTEHAPSFDGRHHRLREARNVPPPIQSDGPPILIGGGGEKVTIPMLARLGDGCNFFGAPATVRHKVDVLERACAAAGRDPATITRTWLGTAIVSEDPHEVHTNLERLARLLRLGPAAARGFALCGSADEVAEQVAAYRAAGIDGVIVNMDDADDLETVERTGRALRAAVDA